MRLAALAGYLGADLIASHLTAAWVWGAARTTGDPLQAATRLGRRGPAAGHASVRVHELRYTEADLTRFGPFGVSRPLRTALDLLHDPSGAGRREVVACRLLFRLIDGGRDAVEEQVRASRRPYRRLAHERFAKLTGGRYCTASANK